MKRKKMNKKIYGYIYILQGKNQSGVGILDQWVWIILCNFSKWITSSSFKENLESSHCCIASQGTGCSFGSNSIPSLGTSIRCGSGSKKKKKKIELVFVCVSVRPSHGRVDFFCPITVSTCLSVCTFPGGAGKCSVPWPLSVTGPRLLGQGVCTAKICNHFSGGSSYTEEQSYI